MQETISTKDQIVKTNNNNYLIYNQGSQNILNKENTYFSEKLKSLYSSTNTDGNEYNKLKKDIGEPHPFNYTILENLAQRFGIISAIIDKLGDYTLGDGYVINSPNKKIIEIIETWRRKTKIDMFLRPWFGEAILKGPSFLEFAEFSLKNTDNIIRHPSANTIFIKKNEDGDIEEYIQYISKNESITNQEIKESLDKDTIVLLKINTLCNKTYGLGFIYSALPVIENFLSAQKSMHKILKRKANSPVHFKVGSVEKDDYPEQSDINAIGKSLQFMNEATEYVTGPNVDSKVLDFGDVSDKFIGVLDNDMKMMSYSFQTPEIIMGSDRSFVGSSEVQERGYERNIKSLQDQIAFVLKNNVYDKLLLNEGITDLDYEIEWNSKSIEEKNNEIKIIKDLLSSSTNISYGMRKYLEQKLATIYEFDYAEIEKENDAMEKKLEQQTKQKPQNEPSEEEEENVEESLGEEIRGIYATHSCSTEIDEDLKISEYLGKKNVLKYKEQILDTIQKDAFRDLKAYTKAQLKQGYLNQNEIRKLRNILSIAIRNDMSIGEIKSLVKSNVFIKDLTKYNKVILNAKPRLNAIVNSELTRVLNKGMKKGYKEKGVKVVEWDASMDKRTCSICADLDGQRFDLNSLTQTTMPPAHVNCRCSIQEIKTTENIKNILEKNLAPQELEEELIRNGIEEEKAKKISEKYIRLNKKNEETTEM